MLSFQSHPIMPGYTHPAIRMALSLAFHFWLTCVLLTLPFGVAAAGKVLTVTWQDNADNELGFVIERKAGQGGHYQQVAVAAADVSHYTDAPLPLGVSHCYRVTAFNARHASMAVEQCEPEFERRHLEWTDNADNEDGFRVERKLIHSRDYQRIATVGRDVRAFVDLELAAGQHYCYRITAFNVAGESTVVEQCDDSANVRRLSWHGGSTDGFIVERRIRAATAYQALALLEGDVFQFTDNGRQANVEYCYRVLSLVDAHRFTVQEHCEGDVQPLLLHWQDLADNERGFLVERTTAADDEYQLLARLADNTSDYADYDIEPGSAYCYRIRAFNEAGTSDGLEQCYDLSAPPRVALDWRARAVDSAGYLLERRVNGSDDYEPLTLVAAGDTGYVDNQRVAGVNYCYRINALTEWGALLLQESCDGTLPLMTLHWVDNADNELGYYIERQQGASGEFQRLATLAGNVNSFDDFGILDSGRYCYRVLAFNEAGSSPASESCYDTAAPATRTLDWHHQQVETDSFEIMRRAGKQGSYQFLARVNGDATTFVDQQRHAGVNYCYRVRYADEGGSFTLQERCDGVSVPVSLKWTDNADNEAGYLVERAQASGVYQTLATVAADASSFDDFAVETAKDYCYRIRAFNSAGLSTAVTRCSTAAWVANEARPALRRPESSPRGQNLGVLTALPLAAISSSPDGIRTAAGGLAQVVGTAVKTAAPALSGYCYLLDARVRSEQAPVGHHCLPAVGSDDGVRSIELANREFLTVHHYVSGYEDVSRVVIHPPAFELGEGSLRFEAAGGYRFTDHGQHVDAGMAIMALDEANVVSVYLEAGEEPQAIDFYLSVNTGQTLPTHLAVRIDDWQQEILLPARGQRGDIRLRVILRRTATIELRPRGPVAGAAVLGLAAIVAESR